MFLLDSSVKDPETGIVVLLGMGIVFIGLILIVFMCKLLGWIVGSRKETSAPSPVAEAQPVEAPQAIPNKGELVAAISAAVAESMGKDVSAIRIKSIRRI